MHFLLTVDMPVVRSSSAILDLEYTNNLDSKAKRRSLSTCGEGSKNTNPAAPSSTMQSKMEMDWSSSPEKVMNPSPSSNLEKQSSSTWRPKSSSGHSHVRFEETPTKCHHLLSEESDRWTSSTTNQPLQPQVVQRTQSNPEMELCPVCLARKECEILLKRTYSKVPLIYNRVVERKTTYILKESNNRVGIECV